MSVGSRIRAYGAMVCAVVALAIGVAPAAAADPLDYVVHTESITVGPYPMTVGFTVWPIRAMQSLDFTFVPDGGIADKSGTLTQIAPDGTSRVQRLARHPRNHAIWGLDVKSFDASGTWTLRFDLDGPRGKGTADLSVGVLEQPGPPLALSWTIGLIPVALALMFYVAVWVRTGSPKEDEQESQRSGGSPHRDDATR